MPCHHALAEALRAYIDAAGIAEDRKGWLFRTARGHNGGALSDKPMSQPDAWRMIRRRSVVDHAHLTHGRPNFTRLTDLETKLRCRQCGRRGGHSLSVSLRPRD